MLTNLIDKLPEYAKDVKLNVSGLINNHSLLSEQQFWGTVVASAMATKNHELIQAAIAQSSDILDEKALNGVKAAFSMMSMTNIYYRFTHMVDEPNYATMPAGLRMNIMRDPGVDKIDFEIWSLAVSVIGGCSVCIQAHEKQMINHNFTQEGVQLVAKVAAVMNSLANTLSIL
jgi:lipoyl-dependent peroxiredoxin subunit D